MLFNEQNVEFCKYSVTWGSCSSEGTAHVSQSFVILHYSIYIQCKIFYFNLNYAFPYVLLNCLPESMHSHICCICLACLHCVFSSAPSNCPSDRRHNHIGCICLAEFHCVFLSVFSNWMPGRMHSHTDCTCLIFFRCVRSYVISTDFD